MCAGMRDQGASLMQDNFDVIVVGAGNAALAASVSAKENGAKRVLVGPNLPLTGQRGVVKPWPNHDNHLHVRIESPEPE